MKRTKFPVHLLLWVFSFSAAFSAVLYAADPAPAVNLPTGEKVISGSVTVDRSVANNLNVNIASPNAIVEWANFSVGAGFAVNFNFNIAQPSLGSILNSVTGSAMSVINGAINSNGNVLLTNPNGIMFGQSATVNAASFLASTLKMDYDSFLNPVNGQYKFFKDGAGSFIKNAGRIAAQPGGYIALLSQAVENSGTLQVSSIDAKVGHIVLASGEKMTIAMDDRSLISIAIDEGVKDAIFGPDGVKIDSAIKNSGSILADGAKVTLTAKTLNKVFDYAINNTGIIQANNIVNHDGVIELVAEGAPILNTGTIEAGKVIVNAPATDLINRGQILSQPVADPTILGNIQINAINLMQDGKILSNGLVTIDVDNVDTTQVIVVTPESLAQDPTGEATLPAAVIQGKEVRIHFKKLGTADRPIRVDSPQAYFYRTEGDINLLESTGIGTSMWMRGPPEDSFSLISLKDSNLFLDADHINLVGSAPISFYGNITFSSLTCTVPGKTITFEAGKTYTITGVLKIQGAEGGLIELLSSQDGSPWYIDPQGPRDLTYVWVKDSYNVNPDEIIMTQSTNRGNCYNWDATRTWTGGGADNNWTTAANWGGTAPSANDDLVFPSGALRLSNNNNFAAGTTFASIQFTGTSGGYTLSGNPISLGTGDITSSNTSGTNTISLNISLPGNRVVTVTNAGGTLVINGVISQSSGTRTLTKQGAGTLTLSGVNTYTGTTTISAGTLSINTIQNVGGGASSLGAPTTVGNGTIAIGATGILKYTGSGHSSDRVINKTTDGSTIDASGSGTLTLTGGITGNNDNLVLTGTGNGIESGVIGSGNATLTKSGTGTWTLSGTNTYTGTTTINAGVLNIQNNSALGTTGAVTVASGATLQIQGGITVNKTLTLNGTGISNDGALRNISGNNIWSGAITLGSATRINSDSGTLTMTGGIIGAGQSLTLGGAGNITVSTTAISGAGTALTKDGAGTLTLSVANTFTGGTTLSAGTLNINNANALGTVAGTFTINGGTIDNTSGANITTLNYPLALNGDFTYSGSVPRNLNLGTGAVTLNADRQIAVSAGSLTIGGTISAAARNLTKAGAGTLSFGSNTVTLNSLTINAGTLTSTSGTLSLAGDFTNNGTFTHNSGTVTFNGAAVQTLSGSSSTTFNILTINNTNGITLNSATTIGTLNHSNTGRINITVTAVTDTKTYNGTTSSAGVPTITAGSLRIGDTGSWSQTFDNKNFGSGKTLTPAGTVSGASTTADYHITFTSVVTGVITQRPITVTAAANSKTYDGLLTAAGVPTITAGTLAAGDTGTFTETYDNKNVGTTHVLTPAGTIADGGAVDMTGNYAITFTPISTGVITQRPITVTAATNSKTYDGLLTAAGVPTITAGTLAAGDTGTFTETYDNKNVGTTHVLTPAGTIADGGAVDMTGNYAITFTPISTGVITQRPITVTATANTKIYDKTTASSAIPTLTSGSLAAGDTATWSETFADVDVGTRTLTPAGTVSDGNGGANYSITFVTVSGTITQRPITVTAAANTKTYDGLLTAAGIPTITAGTLAGGDTGTFTETYDTKNVGTTHVLTPSGTVLDGNGGANYAITFSTISTGVITKAPLTVALTGTVTKVFDGTNTVTNLTPANYALSGFVGSESATITQTTGTYASVSPGTGINVSTTLASTDFAGTSGFLTGNYLLPTSASGNIGTITPLPPTPTLIGGTTHGTITQLAAFELPRHPAPDLKVLQTFQTNTFTPNVRPVYFYQPLTSFEMGAFNAMFLAQDDLSFLNGEIMLGGHAGLLPS